MSDEPVFGGDDVPATDAYVAEHADTENVEPYRGGDTLTAVSLSEGQYERARRLYIVYGDDANWQNHAGNDMPTWDELPDATKAHWFAVANVSGTGPCEARMANLEAAVSRQAELMGKLVEGVNLLGTQYNTFVEFAQNFQQQMANGGGIMGMIKAMRGGK